MRTIISNTQRVTAGTWESAVFLLVLLVFGIASAWFVWEKGVADGKRKVHKLVVECLLIIASVVPPELPIQLNLAVNQSLLALTKLSITCTEPFRITFGGKLDVCCFDKTGTLTADEFEVDGVAGIAEDPEQLIKARSTTDAYPETARVIAGCHSLVLLTQQDTIIGDPLERAALKSIKWAFRSANSLVPNYKKIASSEQKLRILQRFHFASALKRMSTVIEVTTNENPTPRYMGACKGAPETVGAMLRTKPDNYDAIHKGFARQGKRVLALAYKYMDGSVKGQSPVKSEGDAMALSRESIECDLVFAGFLVVSSPVKEDSAEAIGMLRRSNHHVVMITGDSPLTACHVSGQLGLTDKPIMILKAGNAGVTSGGDSVLQEWASVDEKTTQPFVGDRESIAALFEEHDLCMPGPTVAIAHSTGLLKTLLPYVKVYARGTPDQKAVIITGFEDLGMRTLMCGDGTNDVGALKRAHVGVALIPGDTAAKKKKKKKSEDALIKSARRKTPEEEYKELMEEQSSVPKLGDASIAAPFTSKLPTVMSTVRIVRQGRCTLVTSHQMLIILALNCLVNAYAMSVLYLDGIKNSDTQKTVVSLVVAAAMFLATMSTPLEELAPQRPDNSIISVKMFCTIFGQFAVHLWCMHYIVSLAKETEPLVEFDPDAKEGCFGTDVGCANMTNSTECKNATGCNWVADAAEFNVTLVNTVVFLISISMQASTIFTNYHGAPFMAGLTGNKGLVRCLLILWGIAIFATAGISTGFNEFLELVPLETSFASTLAAIMVLDFAGAWMVDALVGAAFPLSVGSATCARRSK